MRAKWVSCLLPSTGSAVRKESFEMEIIPDKAFEIFSNPNSTFMGDVVRVEICLYFLKYPIPEAAPAREDCLALAATTASLTVRCPQRYVFLFSFFIETRGESETYKKDGTDKDYTANT
ncbi:hypothetical protein TNCV_2466871 [Trichonephila clavipes]|nr:hypothetical protein TNCV_2466871 [Trichonephila clavipes]